MTVLTLGGLMLMVGVAFKLSAVPFHFWAPDVFEGATAEVAAFLSVASKAAALGLLVRLATGFAYPSGLAFPESSLPRDPAAIATAVAALAPVRQYIVVLISVLAAVTCTFGNLAAYGQTNMKRLLAYSTIAHAGYMMMPVAAAVSLLGDATTMDAARDAVSALIVYIGIYLFMNLAAFAIVAFLRNAIHSEEIADYAGLIRTLAGFGRVHGDRVVQPGGCAAVGRLLRQVARLSLPDFRQSLSAADRRHFEYRAQPVLLLARREGDGDVARAVVSQGPQDSAVFDGRFVLRVADASRGIVVLSAKWAAEMGPYGRFGPFPLMP